MSSKLRAIFSKAIDRPLDGVIKADDEVSLLNELEEYVVTNEIEKNVSNFLTEYNNYTHKNGVWPPKGVPDGAHNRLFSFFGLHTNHQRHNLKTTFKTNAQK